MGTRRLEDIPRMRAASTVRSLRAPKTRIVMGARASRPRAFLDNADIPGVSNGCEGAPESKWNRGMNLHRRRRERHVAKGARNVRTTGDARSALRRRSRARGSNLLFQQTLRRARGIGLEHAVDGGGLGAKGGDVLRFGERETAVHRAERANVERV